MLGMLVYLLRKLRTAELFVRRNAVSAREFAARGYGIEREAFPCPSTNTVLFVRSFFEHHIGENCFVLLCYSTARCHTVEVLELNDCVFEKRLVIRFLFTGTLQTAAE